jgi:hypothetical protein
VTARRGARLWLFDLECVDEESCTLEPIDNGVHGATTGGARLEGLAPKIH